MGPRRGSQRLRREREASGDVRLAALRHRRSGGGLSFAPAYDPDPVIARDPELPGYPEEDAHSFDSGLRHARRAMNAAPPPRNQRAPDGFDR